MRRYKMIKEYDIKQNDTEQIEVMGLFKHNEVEFVVRQKAVKNWKMITFCCDIDVLISKLKEIKENNKR